MERLLHTLVILWVLTWAPIVASAQQNRPPDAPPPPPPPADDYSPKRWKEFSSQEGGFKVLLPGKPQASDTTAKSAVGDLAIHTFTYQGVIGYTVLYIDYPANVQDPASTKKFFDAMRDGGISNVAQANPRIVKETDFSLGGHPGRSLQIELAGDMVIRIRYIALKNRVYNLIATSRKAQANIMGSENDYELIATAFLDSFQLTKF